MGNRFLRLTGNDLAITHLYDDRLVAVWADRVYPDQLAWE